MADKRQLTSSLYVPFFPDEAVEPFESLRYMRDASEILLGSRQLRTYFA